ncbi:MAG TPA: MucB/RseB C-terminal domain-containing protein [Gammaproteobacteria bacterium]
MSRNRRLRYGAILLAGLWLAGMPAVAQEDARDWLRQMSAASQELNYRGTFVYMHQGRLEAMRIIHRAAEGGEQERLVALTGDAREVIRDKERVTCILPKSKAVMVGRSLPRKPFPAALPRDLDDLADNYEFLVQGEERVAGLPARIVLIRPRDAYRYGYRLWLDSNSRLLLKSELIDTGDQAVEQIMFTDLELLDTIPESELQTALRGEDYTRKGHDRPAETAAAAVSASDWTVSRLPPGFILTHSNRHALPTAGGDEVEHLVFSDGLATVSVYIEPESASDQSGLAGASSMGAVNALGLRQNGHQITVVGEVPQLTVERMGESVQRKP